jgi:hypothetical protein
MSSDDFFSKVDEKLKASKETQASVKADASENLDFLKEVVFRITPLANNYAAKLQDRGIKVDLKSTAFSISFSLIFNDGGHYAIILGSSSASNRFEITGDYTNDDGRNYTSKDGASYDSKNWKDEIYEEKLKACIDNFIFYADRHGGF